MMPGMHEADLLAKLLGMCWVPVQILFKKKHVYVQLCVFLASPRKNMQNHHEITSKLISRPKTCKIKQQMQIHVQEIHPNAMDIQRNAK